MEFHGLGLLSFFYSAWTIFGIVATYLLTVLSEHVQSYFIYISKTGEQYPESLVFTFVFVVSGIYKFLITYCMYRYVTMHSAEAGCYYPRFQYTILALSVIACISTLLVGIFPATTHPVTHRTAAGIGFGGSLINYISHTIILYRMSLNSRRMFHLRLAICILAGLCFTALSIARLVFTVYCTDDLCFQTVIYIEVITEWTGASSLVLYNLTLYPNLQNLGLKWHWSLKESCLFLREKQQDRWSTTRAGAGSPLTHIR